MMSPPALCRRVLVVLLWFTLAATTVVADDEGTLIIEADSPCCILIDDVFIFRVEPSSPRRHAVAEGTYDLSAVSTEVLGVTWQDMIQIDEDEELEVAIIMAEEVEFELEGRQWGGPGWDEDDVRFERIARDALRDPDSELQWTLTDNAFGIDWETAGRYCETLGLAVSETDDGDPRPWRLPTIDELKTIIDDRSDREYRVEIPVSLTGCCAWSSEEYGSVSAWYMDFSNGRRGFVAKDYTEGGRVLCVR
jgi:hypothetical protein